MERCLFFILSGILCLQRVSAQSQGSESNDSYRANMPDHLWQLDNSHHGYSLNSHTLYAYLHNVYLIPGPYNASTNAALLFTGNAGSYVNILNSNGALNASSAFAWMMLLRPASVPSKGVILQYGYSSGDILLTQDGEDLVAEARTISNPSEVLTVVKKNLFVQDEWKFIILTFKEKFRIITADYNETEIPTDVTEIDVDVETVLYGEGDVLLGAPYNASLPGFNGSVSCLRFYDDFITEFQEGYVLSCDPNSAILKGSLDALSEYTMDYVPQPYVSAYTGTIATPVTTATVTPAPPVFSSPDILTIEDSCVQLTREPGLATFSHGTPIMANLWVNTLGSCASACASASGCAAVSVEKRVRNNQQLGRCLMAGEGYQTTVDTDFYLFHMKF